MSVAFDPSRLFTPDEALAHRLDERDPLLRHRERFEIPRGADGAASIYLNGNSLGLMPRMARDLVRDELDAWARLGVEGHFKAPTPWYSYHESVREPLARLVGAEPAEVVAMNGLTVNLHLMMTTFYRPTAERHKILVEHDAFPSDTYAVGSQVRVRGYDPSEAVVVARPRPGETFLRVEDVEEILARDGRAIALVMMSGVHFLTGQRFDLERITAAAKAQGCAVGFDLAHAVGNVPLRLHDWGPDFAVWCSYKYLNAGPGAVAGCFVHARHAKRPDLPRFAGWWGNDPATRFRMHLEPEFVARDGADGWQLSNPPILAMAPLRASLAIFEESGMAALRAKSVMLTGYLEFLLRSARDSRYEIVTPTDPEQRGCQLSLRVGDRPKERFDALEAAGIVADFREPDVIRVAPVPLYNTFHEVWRFAHLLEATGLAE